MAGIRFTKDERMLIRAVLGNLQTYRELLKWEIKARDSVLDKLEMSELVGSGKKPTGIGWKVAADAMREVLGASLALPPRPDATWMIRMSNRIRDLGLSADDCRTIAKVMDARPRRFQSTHSFERMIWDADKLLAESQLTQTQAPPARSTAPLSM